MEKEKKKKKKRKERVHDLKEELEVGWLGFYGISTFVGYLIPNPFYENSQFYLKQFSFHTVECRNSSILNNLV